MLIRPGKPDKYLLYSGNPDACLRIRLNKNNQLKVLRN